jgi:hypothetical protein
MPLDYFSRQKHISNLKQLINFNFTNMKESIVRGLDEV